MKRREGLVAARLHKNWSQQKAAEELGVSFLAYSKWERGVATPHPVNICRICEVFEMSAEELDLGGSDHVITRRDAVVGISGALMAMESLGSYEEALGQCALGIPTCWGLYFEGKVEHVANIMPMYRLYLSHLVQQSGPLQRQALMLASQAWQLMSEIGIDQEDYSAAQDAASRALLYAREASDENLQVSSLIRQSNIFFHHKQPTYALQACQQALSLTNNVSPLLRGRAYVGVAEIEGMRQEKQAALTAMGKADELYPEEPELDQAYQYTRFTHYSRRVFGRGQTQLYLGNAKEALEEFEYVAEHMIDPKIEPLSAVDLMYYQAEASVMLNELEAATQKTQEAATLARDINSRLYFGKIEQTYNLMTQKWGNDARVTALADVFQPW